MDDTDIDDNIGLYGIMDTQRSTTSCTGKGNGNRVEILEVFKRLVGLLFGSRYIDLVYYNINTIKLN